MPAPRVHRLNCATACPLAARLVNGPGHPWLARGRIVCHCLLVESDAGLILVDTGLGHDDVTRPRERLGLIGLMVGGFRCDPAETALAQVRRLGFRAEDVAHVIPTHLDVDHVASPSSPSSLLLLSLVFLSRHRCDPVTQKRATG